MEKIHSIQKIFNRIYYFLFVERFKKKINFNFPENFSRLDMINYFIRKMNYKHYLEIGCDKDQIFSKIFLKNKIGVDPVSGGNVRLTSDQFFKENSNNFDIIFVDGLHEYKQVKRDILNSIQCLNENGIILVHDCLPESLAKQAVPRYKMQWNGDVWKAIVDLRREKNLEIFTCKVDQGIGIIQNKENSSILNLDKKIKELKFEDFYYNHLNYMRMIDLHEFKKIF